MRAAIYSRISRDATGEGLGVARQEADCRSYCATRGWDVTEVHTDNDLSAGGRTRRPGYQALLDSIQHRRVDALVVWHPDRLHRSPRELEAFIDLVEATGCQVATVTAGVYDLTTADGRLSARITGAVARKEWEDKKRRAKRKAAELRDAGKPSGMLGYGYTSGGEIVPDQAEVIRDAARRILTGDNLTAIVADLTTRQVPPPRLAWSTTGLRKILMSGRIAGLREHGGRVVGPATWPAIIDRVTWERVRATLTSRPGYRTRRDYLLSGVARCAECDGPLVGHTRYKRNRTPVATYACVKARGGCGGVYVTAGPVDDAVDRRMRAELPSDSMRRRLAEMGESGPNEDELLAAIALEEAKLAGYAEMLDAGDLEPVEWRTLRRGVLGRLEGLRVQLRTDGRTEALQRLVAQDWDDLTVDERRTLAGTFLDVKVSRVVRGGPLFDPDRVQVGWRR